MNAITEFFQCDWPEMLERLQKLEAQITDMEACIADMEDLFWGDPRKFSTDELEAADARMHERVNARRAKRCAAQDCMGCEVE